MLEMIENGVISSETVIEEMINNGILPVEVMEIGKLPITVGRKVVADFEQSIHAGPKDRLVQSCIRSPQFARLCPMKFPRTTLLSSGKLCL